jgi:hypothetical protein
MKPAIYLIIFIVLLFQSCSKNGDNSVSHLTPEQKQIQTHILNLQESCYSLFEQYIEEMDTTTAIDSLVKIIKKDTEVKSVESNIQGILIKNKSGIWGGLFIDAEMHPEIQEIDLESDLDIYGIKSTKQPVIATNKDAVVPSNKKVRILCTVYDEFYHYKLKFYDSLQKFFPKAGYQVVQFDKNDEVTVEKMKNIDDAGIVIIDTHGWAVSYSKDDDDFDEIFISTGEEINDQTSADYWS